MKIKKKNLDSLDNDEHDQKTVLISSECFT